MLPRGSTSATLAVFALIAAVPSAGAASDNDDNTCMTTVLFGYQELVIAPVLGDAIGVVVGTHATAQGAGLTLIVRPDSCGLAGVTDGVSAGRGHSSSGAPDGLPTLPIVP